MLDRSAVTFTVSIDSSDIDYRGNCSATGDDVADAETEKWVCDQLDNGNAWAWCTVQVAATVEGIAIEGTDYLGGCSYLSEADFTTPGGYYDDMKDRALEDLEEQIIEACKRITTPLVG